MILTVVCRNEYVYFSHEWAVRDSLEPRGSQLGSVHLNECPSRRKVKTLLIDKSFQIQHHLRVISILCCLEPAEE